MYALFPYLITDCDHLKRTQRFATQLAIVLCHVLCAKKLQCLTQALFLTEFRHPLLDTTVQCEYLKVHDQPTKQKVMVFFSIRVSF